MGTGWQHLWTESRRRQRAAGRQGAALIRARLGMPFDPRASEPGFGLCSGLTQLCLQGAGAQPTAAPRSMCCRRGLHPSKPGTQSIQE